MRVWNIMSTLFIAGQGLDQMKEIARVPKDVQTYDVLRMCWTQCISRLPSNFRKNVRRQQT